MVHPFRRLAAAFLLPLLFLAAWLLDKARDGIRAVRNWAWEGECLF